MHIFWWYICFSCFFFFAILRAFLNNNFQPILIHGMLYIHIFRKLLTIYKHLNCVTILWVFSWYTVFSNGAFAFVCHRHWLQLPVLVIGFIHCMLDRYNWVCIEDETNILFRFSKKCILSIYLNAWTKNVPLM